MAPRLPGRSVPRLLACVRLAFAVHEVMSRRRRAEEVIMPEPKTIERAKEDLQEGKGPSTAAGEFVREEMHHVREGKHGARSTKQAIAIGLSKARRAGVPLKPPGKGRTSERTRENAERAYETRHGTRS